MNIGEWTIKNSPTTIVICLLIIFLGTGTFLKMSRLEDPEYTLKTAVVITYLPGASPKRVEKLVTDKLEKAIREIPEIETINSQSMSGVSIITVNVYEKYKVISPIWEKLRNKVNDNKHLLPPEAQNPIIKDDFGDLFDILITLRGDGYSYRELKNVADNIKDELFTVDGIGKIQLYGQQEERIYIEFSNSRLAEFGFTPFLLAESLKNQNTIAASGEAKVEDERILLDTTGEFQSLNQLKNFEIQIPGKAASVRLGDFTNIKREYVSPPQPITHFNNQKAIVIAVNMAKGENLVELGERVVEKIADIESKLPTGLKLDFLIYQPKYVERSISDFMSNLREAIFFVFVVMLMFTGVQAGWITGILIPMTLLLTIMTMPLFDVSLQRVSIASMIIALGILVDNGVVVTENLLVRFSSGQNKIDAVKGAVNELWMPLLVSSITIICAFLPIPLAKSKVGEYTMSIFIVLTLALLYSWLLALTLIPFICYYCMKPKIHHQTYSSKFYKGYRAALLWCLTHRPIFLGIIISLFTASTIGFTYLPQTFFSPNEREMFLIDFWMPYGTDIETTATQVSRLEQYLLKQPNVTSVGTFIGEGGPRWYLTLNPEQINPNYALLIVNTTTIEAVNKLYTDSQEYLRDNFPEVKYFVKKLEIGPAVGEPIRLRISGDDIDTLYKLRDRVEEIMKTVPGIVNIHDDWGEWTKKLVVQVRQQEAKRAGFTSTDIAQSLRAQTSGYQATQYREGDTLIPVVIRSVDYHKKLGDIESANVYSLQTRKSIPLLEVAQTVLEWQPSDIRRRNTTRTLTILANVDGRLASQVINELAPKVNQLVDSAQWPQGYHLAFGGEAEESNKARLSILAGIPLSLTLLVFTLFLQFNSFRNVAIIMLTMPLIIIGITPGLFITHVTFGFMAMLGFVSLAGIVVNNAILLLDRINIEQKNGESLEDSILLSAQRRLRPILATKMITIMGLVPLSLHGGELWRPMANTIISGLLFASVLTLALCPVLYSYFYHANFKNYRWRPELATEEKILD